MITGDSLLVTHWAYMLPYDPASFMPPPPAPANSLPQWAWTAGTPWRIVSPAMFGTTSPGALRDRQLSERIFLGHRRRAVRKFHQSGRSFDAPAV
jgi:hypothetical protein